MSEIKISSSALDLVRLSPLPCQESLAWGNPLLSIVSSSLICTGTGNSSVLKVRKGGEPADRQADLTLEIKLTPEAGGWGQPGMQETMASRETDSNSL